MSDSENKKVQKVRANDVSMACSCPSMLKKNVKLAAAKTV